MALDWKTGDDPEPSKPAKPSLWDRLNQPIGGSGKKKSDVASGSGLAVGHEDSAVSDATRAGQGGWSSSDASDSAGHDASSDTARLTPDVTDSTFSTGGPETGSSFGGATRQTGSEGADFFSPKDVHSSEQGPNASATTSSSQQGGHDFSSGATAPRPATKGSSKSSGDSDHGSSAFSFGGKGHRSAKGSSLPTKRTMNLYQPTGERASAKKTAIVGVCLACAVAAFVWFAVRGPLQAVSDKQQELASIETQLDAAREAVADYDEISEQYQQYTPASSSSGVDATATFTLIDQHVRNRATLTSATLQDTTLTIDVADVTLKSVGEITADLAKQQSLGVKSASVVEAAGINPSSGLTDESIVTAEIEVQLVGSDSSSDSDASSSSDSSSTTSSASSSDSTTSNAAN